MTDKTDEKQAQDEQKDQAPAPTPTRGRPKKKTSVTNKHRAPVAIDGLLWKPGQANELEKEMLNSKRVQNAIKNGILKEA